MKLTEEHILYISKDLHYRGVVLEDFQDEIMDHICSSVEVEMDQGKRFIDAYHDVLKKFGHTSGLLHTQKETLRSKTQSSPLMIRNYFRMAFRNLSKQRFYSFINISGLAIGVSACLIIVLFVMDELSYDRYNTKADRIFRVHNEVKFGDNHWHGATSPAPMANALLQEYPEIESTLRFYLYGTYLVKGVHGSESIKEENVGWVDSTFFKFFSVKMLEGNPVTALREPASVAISKRTAEKYYPGENAVGKSLILDNKYNVTITAVFDDMPTASHFHFDILIAMVGDFPAARDARSTDFSNNNFSTYLLLKEGADARLLESKLPAFVKKYIVGDSGGGRKQAITLMPLLDIHLYSDLGGELEANGSITYIYLFTTIAVFILVIACINFMTLSTARSGSRAKEVGVRKVMGSLRSHLVRQFLTESILITSFAFVLAVGLVYVSLPFFNDLSLKELSLPLDSPVFFLILAGSMIAVGILAGVYPAFFLSAFKPVSVLKGTISLGMKSGFIRSSLVVVQFVISILLIIAAISVNRQLHYIQNKKLGFEKDQCILIKDAYALRPNVRSFKNKADGISSVESCSISGFIPVLGSGVARSDRSFWNENDQPDADNLVSLQHWRVDFDYIETMGMTLVKGRGFSPEFPSDSAAVVLNEAAVARFNLGNDPVGKKINTFSAKPDRTADFEHPTAFTVIGVTEDFHFSSLKNSISPLGLFIGRSDGFIAVKFNAAEAQETIKSLEKIWKELAPGQPFQYSFLDDDFARMYTFEQRLGALFTAFATLAIVIACLGLFGLTAFIAEQRTKEIGIRKVLGASVSGIVMLLSKEFGKLILVAFLLSAPVAWYGVHWWLESYTYKTDISIFIFLLAGVLVFTVAWFTMGYQSIKAATTNPINSLRNE